jgi:hypothetical protein
LLQGKTYRFEILPSKGGQCTDAIDAGGANFVYDSVDGLVSITDCEFRHGVCTRDGGNLSVRTSGKGEIIRSNFIGGSHGGDNYGGGGALVMDSEDATIQECNFDSNQGSGLIVYGWDDEDSIIHTMKRLLVKNSLFSNNQGSYAGAIFVSNLV